MRRTAFIALITLIVVGIGAFVFYRQQAAANEPAFEILREAEVVEGKIDATVSAVGSIEPEALVTLTFGLAGTITEVAADRGQSVQAGDILATLDTQELQLAVQQAEDALHIQELTLQQRANSSPSEATLASARADIDAANANLAVAEANLASAEAAVLQAQAQKAQLLTPATSAQITAAEAQVAQAFQQQDSAQKQYDQVTTCFNITKPDGSREEKCPGLGAPEEQARAALNAANASLIAAQAQLDELQTGPRAADIQAADAAIASAQAGVLAAQGNVAAAEANVARANAAYDRLLEPPSDDEIAILEAQVAGAQTNLALAQLRLEQSIIEAPISGTIASVLINPGEQAAPGAPAMTIVNEGAFHITVSVDEIDIDRIDVGQPVEITLDALPDLMVPGTIAEIAPTSAGSGGVVTYLVTINIEPDEGLVLRPGMSANASIVVEEVDNVLIVPNWAIRLERETGNAYVNLKQDDGTVTEVVVETGLRNEQFSEVTAGVNPGDVVVITNEREVFSFFGGGEG